MSDTDFFQRGELTAALISILETLGKPIGDAEAPPGGGWVGEPGAAGSQYVPYTVVLPGSVGQAVSSTFGEPQSDWQVPYLLSSFGVSREQCEWMSDNARGTAQGLTGRSSFFGSFKYEIQQVRVMSIGGIVRNDQGSPVTFGQVDTISIWLSKEL